MKLPAILFLLALPCASGFAQTNVVLNSKLKKSSWGFSWTPSFMMKSKIRSDVNRYNVKSDNQLSPEFLLNYYRNLSPNYSIVLSAGGLLMNNNLTYNIKGHDFDPPRADNLGSRYSLGITSDLMFKMQAAFEARFHKTSFSGWLVSPGMSLLITERSDGEGKYFAGPGLANEYLTLTTTKSRPVMVNLNILAGYEWTLRSVNVLQLAVKFNYAPAPYLEGNYHIYPGNSPEQVGSYKVSTSYAGLSIAYIFGRFRKA